MGINCVFSKSEEHMGSFSGHQVLLVILSFVFSIYLSVSYVDCYLEVLVTGWLVE